MASSSKDLRTGWKEAREFKSSFRQGWQIELPAAANEQLPAPHFSQLYDHVKQSPWLLWLRLPHTLCQQVRPQQESFTIGATETEAARAKDKSRILGNFHLQFAFHLHVKQRRKGAKGSADMEHWARANASVRFTYLAAIWAALAIGDIVVVVIAAPATPPPLPNACLLTKDEDTVLPLVSLAPAPLPPNRALS